MTPTKRVSPFDQDLYFAIRVVGGRTGRPRLLGTERPKASVPRSIIIRTKIVLIEGRPELVELEIGSNFSFGASSSPIAITSDVLRGIRVAELMQTALRRNAQELRQLSQEHPNVAALSRRLARAEEIAARGRRGVKDKGLHHYQEVAKVYNAAVISRQPPTKAVQEHWKEDYETAKRWVNTARHKYGLLPLTQAGKARGAQGLDVGKESER